MWASRGWIRRSAAPQAVAKPINIIVITDGIPTDDVGSVIIGAAKKLDKLDAPPWQVGIQFLQVGNDSSAAAYLKYLDDGLKAEADGELLDMVDTMPFTSANGGTLTAEGILKVCSLVVQQCFSLTCL